MQAILHAKVTRRGVFAVFTSLCVVFLISWNMHLGRFSTLRKNDLLIDGTSKSLRPPCWDLPGANDTLVILRTGSSELNDRLLVHLSTSLRCYPHYLIFSDLEQRYHGETILDALESVSGDIREKHQDFEIYRRLQREGRAGLDPLEMSGPGDILDQKNGNVRNPSWKLDKWKFMPMVNRTFHEYPEKRWYVFVEADTFILWAMLLQYLSLLDHTEPYYAGCGTCLGKFLFAHGGSAFIMSQPAMQLVTQHYAASKSEIETLTDREWAGDYILGKALDDAGVQFVDAWPHFQGDHPGLIDYANAGGRTGLLPEWCVPTISYHHMSSDMIRDLWAFEQHWIDVHPDRSDTLKHGDVFRQYVIPQMTDVKAGWDNYSAKEELGVSDFDECRLVCRAQPECKQYMFINTTKQCRTSADIRLGKPTNDMQSGWLRDRVLDFERNVTTCGEEGWMLGPKTRRTMC